MLRHFRYALVALFLSSAAHAYGDYATSLDTTEHPVYLGLGLLSQNLMRTTTQDSGSTSFFGSTYFLLQLSGQVPIGGSFGFSPEFFWAPTGHSPSDNGQTTTLIGGALRLNTDLGSGWKFNLGPGVLIEHMSPGSNATISLANGFGTTAFGLPTDSRNLITYTVELGFSYTVSSARADIQAILTDLASTRRAVDLVMSFNWGFF